MKTYVLYDKNGNILRTSNIENNILKEKKESDNILILNNKEVNIVTDKILNKKIIKKEKKASNQEKIERYREQVELEIPTTITKDEYLAILSTREAARIELDKYKKDK